ncbi:MAG: response regulator [Terriglobia bacterium]
MLATRVTMNNQTKAYADLLQHKRIGLIAFSPGETAIEAVLQRARAMFAHIDAHAVNPGARELDRYDILILHVGPGAFASEWLQPEMLQSNSRPLILAGEDADIFSRISLQEHAGETLFEPFVENETIFRLARVAAGMLPRSHPVTHGSTSCVVVADDDRDIVTYLKSIFRNFDVDAHFVSDGRAALAAARQLLPDLLMLDVGMPLLNGIEVLRTLRSDPGTNAIPTVMLTASADPIHVEEGLELGAAGYILKPFGHLDLIRKLKPLLTRSSPVNRLQAIR